MPDRRAYEYRKTIFGTTKDGREVTAYTLRNIRGMRVKLSSLGAAIVSVEMKDLRESEKISFSDMTRYQIMKRMELSSGQQSEEGRTGQKAQDLCWMG